MEGVVDFAFLRKNQRDSDELLQSTQNFSKGLSPLVVSVSPHADSTDGVTSNYSASQNEHPTHVGRALLLRIQIFTLVLFTCILIFGTVRNTQKFVKLRRHDILALQEETFNVVKRCILPYLQEERASSSASCSRISRGERRGVQAEKVCMDRIELSTCRKNASIQPISRFNSTFDMDDYRVCTPQTLLATLFTGNVNECFNGSDFNARNTRTIYSDSDEASSIAGTACSEAHPLPFCTPQYCNSERVLLNDARHNDKNGHINRGELRRDEEEGFLELQSAGCPELQWKDCSSLSNSSISQKSLEELFSFYVGDRKRPASFLDSFGGEVRICFDDTAHALFSVVRWRDLQQTYYSLLKRISSSYPTNLKGFSDIPGSLSSFFWRFWAPSSRQSPEITETDRQVNSEGKPSDVIIETSSEQLTLQDINPKIAADLHLSDNFNQDMSHQSSYYLQDYLVAESDRENPCFSWARRYGDLSQATNRKDGLDYEDDEQGEIFSTFMFVRNSSERPARLDDKNKRWIHTGVYILPQRILVSLTEVGKEPSHKSYSTLFSENLPPLQEKGTAAEAELMELTASYADPASVCASYEAFLGLRILGNPDLEGAKKDGKASETSRGVTSQKVSFFYPFTFLHPYLSHWWSWWWSGMRDRDLTLQSWILDSATGGLLRCLLGNMHAVAARYPENLRARRISVAKPPTHSQATARGEESCVRQSFPECTYSPLTLHPRVECLQSESKESQVAASSDNRSPESLTVCSAFAPQAFASLMLNMNFLFDEDIQLRPDVHFRSLKVGSNETTSFMSDPSTPPCFPFKGILQKGMHSYYGVLPYLLVFLGWIHSVVSLHPLTLVHFPRLIFYVVISLFRYLVLYLSANAIEYAVCKPRQGNCDFSDHVVLYMMFLLMLSIEFSAVSLTHPKSSAWIPVVRIYYLILLGILCYTAYFTALYFHTVPEVWQGYFVGVLGLYCLFWIVTTVFGLPSLDRIGIMRDDPPPHSPRGLTQDESSLGDGGPRGIGEMRDIEGVVVEEEDEEEVEEEDAAGDWEKILLDDSVNTKVEREQDLWKYSFGKEAVSGSSSSFAAKKKVYGTSGRGRDNDCDSVRNQFMEGRNFELRVPNGAVSSVWGDRSIAGPIVNGGKMGINGVERSTLSDQESEFVSRKNYPVTVGRTKSLSRIGVRKINTRNGVLTSSSSEEHFVDTRGGKVVERRLVKDQVRSVVEDGIAGGSIGGFSSYGTPMFGKAAVSSRKVL